MRAMRFGLPIPFVMDRRQRYVFGAVLFVLGIMVGVVMMLIAAMAVGR